MKLVYLSNYFNHHQKYLADELYKHLGDGYKFVETQDVPVEKIQLGYHQYSEPYVLKYGQDTKEEIARLIYEADAVICGEAPVSLIKKRIKAHNLIVRDDERRYKALIKYLKWPIYTYNSLYYNKGVLLGASAFSARDYMLSGMKPSRCYKWGYFPEVRRYENIDEILERKEKNLGLKHLDVSILWVARLIGWKHPESLIYVANRLREDRYAFEINIIGIGPLSNNIQEAIEQNGLSEQVRMLGAMSPEEVRGYMEESNIFLFTSDQNEGWGATLNESMNSACAVVAGHMIGSVPFLLKDGINGMIFKSKKWESLYEKVKWLINHPKERQEMGKKAYETMVNTWNPENAANSLISFIEAKLRGVETPLKEGPCSKADILNKNWMKRKHTVALPPF